MRDRILEEALAELGVAERISSNSMVKIAQSLRDALLIKEEEVESLLILVNEWRDVVDGNTEVPALIEENIKLRHSLKMVTSTLIKMSQDVNNATMISMEELNEVLGMNIA